MLSRKTLMVAYAGSADSAATIRVFLESMTNSYFLSEWMYTVQSPFDEVTTVLPSDVDDDVLLEPVPDCVDIDVPAPLVKPDTLPLPAVTELVMPPAGGVSPGLR